MDGLEGEARQLRERLARLEELLLQLLQDGDDPGRNRLFQTTVTTAYPSAPGAYYALQMVDVTGTQVVGSSATLTPKTPKTLGLNVGGSVPPQGGLVLAAEIGSAWVFEFD